MHKAIYAALMAWVLILAPGAGRALAGELGLTAGVRAEAVAGADVDDGEGSMAVTGTRASLGTSWGGLDYAVARYHWDDASRLPLGNGNDDPWDTLHSLRLDLRHRAMVNDDWGYFVGGGVSAGWEEEMDDAGALHLRAGLLRVLRPGLTLSLGLGGAVHKTGLRAMPLAALAWGAEEEPGFSAVVGLPETWLRYRFDAAWLVRLGARMEGGLYRLADDSPVVSSGYVRQSGVAAAFVADWSPLENLTLSFGPEWHFARELTLYNEDGDEQDSYDGDAAPGFGLGLRYAF